MLDPDQPDLQIVVAGEGRWEGLSHLSIVLGRYGTPNTRGALGVLGPTRMRYGTRRQRRALRRRPDVRHVGGDVAGDKENKKRASNQPSAPTPSLRSLPSTVGQKLIQGF